MAKDTRHRKENYEEITGNGDLESVVSKLTKALEGAGEKGISMMDIPTLFGDCGGNEESKSVVGFMALGAFGVLIKHGYISRINNSDRYSLTEKYYRSRGTR